MRDWKDPDTTEEWFFTTELGCECGATTFRESELLLAAYMPTEGEPPTSLAPFLGVAQLSRAPRVFIDNWGVDRP